MPEALGYSCAHFNFLAQALPNTGRGKKKKKKKRAKTTYHSFQERVRDAQ